MAEAAQFAAIEAVLRSQLSDTTARLEHAQQAVLQRELAVEKLREHAQSLQEKLAEKDATLRRALKSIRQGAEGAKRLALHGIDVAANSSLER